MHQVKMSRFTEKLESLVAFFLNTGIQDIFIFLLFFQQVNCEKNLHALDLN